MKIKWVLFVLLFIVFSSSVFAACPSGNVVALGDSITYHAENQKYGFLKVLKSQCPSQEFKGFGYPGKESGEILTRFDAAASSGNYKTIIVFAGINDLRAGKSASSIEANLAQIYSKAKAKGYSVIALTMVPWKDHVDSEDPSKNWNAAKQTETNKLNQWIKSKPSNVDAVVDIYSKLAAEPDKMKKSYHVGDNLHPYIEGHKIIADAILASGFSDSTGVSSTKTSGASSGYPVCVGADWSKLAESKIPKKCHPYIDDFKAAMEDSGLTAAGFDPLHLLALMYLESGCYTNKEMVALVAKNNKYKSLFGSPKAGLMQAIFACKSVEQCPTPKSQIVAGLNEFKTHAVKYTGNYIKNSKVKLTPEEHLWLTYVSYNKGPAVVKRTLENMKKGLKIQEAVDEACQCWYGTKDGTPSPCRKGKKWNKYKSECNVVKGDIDIVYAGKIYKFFQDYCTSLGGTVQVGTAVAGSSTSSQTGLQFPRSKHPAFTYDYSIDPSFKVDIDYDFSVYDNVTSKIPLLERCLANLSCIKDNITKIETEMKKYNWIGKTGGNVFTVPNPDMLDWYTWAVAAGYMTLNDISGDDELLLWERFCEEPNENAIGSLAEAISECLRSPQVDCSCNYKIPVQPNYDVQKDKLWSFSWMDDPEWKYRQIKFENKGSDVVLTLENPKVSPVITQTIPKAKFLYLDDSLKAEFYKAMTTLGAIRDRIFGKKQQKMDVLAYTKSTKGYSLDIYKQSGKNFSIYPKGKSPAKKTCELNDKYVKLCIVAANSFIGYDQKKDRYGLSPNALKFAYLFKSKVDDVKNFEVSDAKIAQNSTLLSWDKMQGVDIMKYTIYLFNSSGIINELKGKGPSEIRYDDKFKDKMEIIDIDVTSLTNDKIKFNMDWPLKPMCNVSDYTCSVEYQILSNVQGQPVKESLLDDTLYLIEEKKKYLYFLSGLKDQFPYTYGITATTTSGEESPYFTFPDSGKEELSKDDCPPQIAVIKSAVSVSGKVLLEVDDPKYQINGYNLVGSVKRYRVYCGSNIPFDTKDTAFVRDIGGNFKSATIEFDGVACGKGQMNIAVIPEDQNGQFYQGIVPETALKIVTIE